MGELDSATVWMFNHVLDDHEIAGDVELDVAGLTFIDSMGMRSLLRLALRARDAGHLLILRSPRSQLRQLASLFQVNQLIEISDAAEEPLADHGQGG